MTANPHDMAAIDMEDVEAMAAIYEITPEEYERGLAWARQWAIKQQVIAQSRE